MNDLVVRESMDLETQMGLVLSEKCSGPLHMDTEDPNATAGWYRPEKDKKHEVIRVGNDPEVTKINNRLIVQDNGRFVIEMIDGDKYIREKCKDDYDRPTGPTAKELKEKKLQEDISQCLDSVDQEETLIGIKCAAEIGLIWRGYFRNSLKQWEFTVKNEEGKFSFIETKSLLTSVFQIRIEAERRLLDNFRYWWENCKAFEDNRK